VKNCWNPLTYDDMKLTASMDWRLKPDAIKELISNIRALPGVTELKRIGKLRICISAKDATRREELLDELSTMEGILTISRASFARTA
jgi:hypothetical protein